MRTSTTAIIVLVSSSVALGQVSRQPAPRQEKPPEPPPKQVVQFQTSDGVLITADYYGPAPLRDRQAPAAILIHMYPADRGSWKPLVRPLRDGGFGVLAYDIRGKGDSIEPADRELAKRYKDGDKEHFENAWKDTEAAKRWLQDQGDCDITRLVLIGASIGSSISLDYGSRDDAVKAIVCLSPGTKYMKLDSKTHIKKCGKRPILLISPEGEYKAVKSLVKASERTAKGKKYPGDKKQHGTKMFAESYAKKLKLRIVKFVKDATAVDEGRSDEGPRRKGKKRPKLHI